MWSCRLENSYGVLAGFIDSSKCSLPYLLIDLIHGADARAIASSLIAGRKGVIHFLSATPSDAKALSNEKYWLGVAVRSEIELVDMQRQLKAGFQVLVQECLESIILPSFHQHYERKAMMTRRGVEMKLISISFISWLIIV